MSSYLDVSRWVWNGVLNDDNYADPRGGERSGKVKGVDWKKEVSGKILSVPDRDRVGDN